MSGAQILLVEDDESLRDLLRRNLEARHHSVSIAIDAQTALIHLRQAFFDLIILDINLPDQTGWDVLRSAQREERLPLITNEDSRTYLPVVMLSAVRVSQRRLAEFHPLAYLPKPFPMEALLRLANEVAEHKQMRSSSHHHTLCIQQFPQEEELHA